MDAQDELEIRLVPLVSGASKGIAGCCLVTPSKKAWEQTREIQMFAGAHDFVLTRYLGPGGVAETEVVGGVPDVETKETTGSELHMVRLLRKVSLSCVQKQWT